MTQGNSPLGQFSKFNVMLQALTSSEELDRSLTSKNKIQAVQRKVRLKKNSSIPEVSFTSDRNESESCQITAV